MLVIAGRLLRILTQNVKLFSTDNKRVKTQTEGRGAAKTSSGGQRGAFINIILTLSTIPLICHGDSEYIIKSMLLCEF